MRYLRRAIRIILLIVVLIVLAVIIVSRTSFFNQFLRNKVVAYVDENYRGSLKIARIKGSVWGSLRLEQVALLYEGKTIASIPQLSLEYSLLPLFWRTVHLRVALDSPQINVKRQPNGKWNLLEALSEKVPTPPTSGKRSMTIDVDSVEIKDGAIEIVPGNNQTTYQVTKLELDTSVTLPSSGMAVKLHRMTANVAVPKMPLLYTAVSLDYDAITSPATVHLTDLDLRTQRSTISMTGDARLAQIPVVNLKMLLRRLAAEDVIQIYPASQLKADIAGWVTLQGPENALHSVVALNAGGAQLNGTADADVTRKAPNYSVKFTLSNGNVQNIIRTNSAAGILDATINAKGSGSNIATTVADVHLHGRNLKVKQYELGTLDLAATAANQNAHVLLTLAAPAGNLTLHGNSALNSNPTYHVDLTAKHLDISKTGVAGKVQRTDLNLTANADGRGLTPATADTQIKVRINRSEIGQIILNQSRLDARVANNRVDVAQLHLAAAGATIDAKGSAGLAANAPCNLSYVVRSPQVNQVLSLASMKGSGAVDVDGIVNGTRSDLRTRGTIKMTRLQTGGYSVRDGTSRYNLGLNGKGAPYGTFDGTFNGVRAGMELRTIQVALQAPAGLPHKVAVRLNVTDNSGRNDLLATHLTYQPQLIAGQLTQLTLELPTGNWHLSAPADYRQSSRAVTISKLQLVNGVRQLLLDGTIAHEGPQDFNLILNRFDLAALEPLSHRLHDLRGSLSTKLRIAGTASAPTINFAADATGVAMGKQPVGNLTSTMNYAGERAQFASELRQDAEHYLNASGSLPMNVSWDRGVKAKIGNVLDLTVNSPGLSLAQIGSFFPDDVRDFHGAAAINLRIQGTLNQPQAAGTVRITGVGGKIIPLGITVSDAQVIVDATPSAIRIETIEAHSGHGVISGNGDIEIAQYAPGPLNINLTFDQWPAINTQQYAATIGGHLVTDGTLSHPRVHGQLEVLNGTIQPDIAFLSATSNLSPDETIEVIQPGQRVPQPLNQVGPNGKTSGPPAAAPQSSTFNNLAMKVAVIIHRNTWIRHPDAAVELEGNLDVEKNPGGPLRVIGEVRTVRGWINYYNRQFILKT
ncbi:MAG TPA: translocation/assembly module TamB domain-containing protein, partial [Candidatus Binataceae bacterium]|nr:translocation/assembly module TamB domain-containing protein [Candidatus Binataceae bacterium]